MFKETLDKDDKKQSANKKSRIKEEIKSWLETIIAALILAFCINNFIIVNATVPTGSMENIIMPNDKIVALRLSYYWASPERGDIAVFKFPDDETILYVKRVIGLPGDTVEIVNGLVYINDNQFPLEEDYIKDEPIGNHGPFTVPEGHYFMLGDNRQYSIDSRYWNNKFVEEDKILGKVYFRYWPSVEMLK